MKNILKFFSIAVLLPLCFELNAQVGQSAAINIYDPTTIPEALKKEAWVVTRSMTEEFEIFSPGKGILRESRIYTILNEKGKSDLQFVFSSDKFRVLDDLKIKMYDSKGKLTGKYDKGDLSITAANSEFVDDSKVQYLRLTAATYPVTIELEYSIKFNGMINPPSFYIQDAHNSVEQSVFRIKYPTEIAVEYKAYNLAKKPVSSNNGKTSTHEWSFQNLPAIIYEKDSWSWRDNIPQIALHSNKFEIDDYKGDLTSWKSYGAWCRDVIGNRNQLSEQNKKQVRELVSGITDEREKIKRLYKHLQENFRYVSIQLGIGGWKPFPADFVHEKKYGDCKGLTNYMQACLSAVGIKSYYSVVNAGADEKPVDPEFPHNSFNHIILCAIVAKDSIWLECTSRTNDFGVLGNFTENRNALLITEEGGVLVSTPKSKAVNNEYSMKTRVELEEDGSGNIKSTLFSTGEPKDQQLNISKLNADQQKVVVVDFMGFANPDELDIKFSTRESLPYKTNIDVTVDKIPDFVAGSKMFIRPRMYHFNKLKMPVTEKRVYDYLFDFPYTKTDTTVFKIPEGFGVEVLPSSKTHACESGQYTSKYWFDEKEREVYSTATLIVKDYKIAPGKYDEMRLFFDKVIEAENQKLIIKKL